MDTTTTTDGDWIHTSEDCPGYMVAALVSHLTRLERIIRVLVATEQDGAAATHGSHMTEGRQCARKCQDAIRHLTAHKTGDRTLTHMGALVMVEKLVQAQAWISGFAAHMERGARSATQNLDERMEEGAGSRWDDEAADADWLPSSGSVRS